MPALSVLIVDDDVDIAANVSDILQEFGYTVTSAHDGESALAKVNESKFDVALLDFKMPDMDGATLYERIRKIQPQMVAIMVTANAGSDGVDRAIGAGVWQVLRKPVEIPELLGKIESVSNQALILVVDDDEDFCFSLWEILREKNFRVGIAHNELEAKRQCGTVDYDVVLLDLHLGEHTSEAILKSLCTDGNNAVRTILITGNRKSMEDSAEMKLLRGGVESVFYKPLPLDELFEKIETLLLK